MHSLKRRRAVSDFHVSYVSELAREIQRRRAFAIIAHPDAGKTTLTEKLLLYGGAIHLAGHVRARKDRKSTKSDFMALQVIRVDVKPLSMPPRHQQDPHCHRGAPPQSWVTAPALVGW